MSNVDVIGCSCASSFPTPPTDLTCLTNPQTCSNTCNAPPPISPVISRSKLTQCGSGCVDANVDCNGCYIWFHSLCTCIHNFQTGQWPNCIASHASKPGQQSQPPWVVLNNGDLIATTQLIPGTLQLGSAPDPDGWFRLGQNTLGNGFPGQQYTRQTGTLAIDGVSSRSEEQIHINLCNNPNNGVHKILDQQHRDNFRVSLPVDLSPLGKPNAEMMCRVSPKRDEVVNLARYILDHLGTVANTCAQDLVGGGVVTDSHGYSWACVTTGTRAAETLFCSD